MIREAACICVAEIRAAHYRMLATDWLG